MPSCLLCSGRYQAPTMRRRSSFVLNEYRVESSCRRSRPPAQERGRRRRPSNERERLCVVRTARRATPPCLFFAHLTRVPLKAWVRDPARVFYPGSRGSRGPRRLCSLSPDRSAAAPSSWRSRETTLHKTVRTARVKRVDDHPNLRDFQDRARGDHSGRDISPQGNHQLARHRHNPNPARSLPFPNCSRYHVVRALWGCQRTQFHAS